MSVRILVSASAIRKSATSSRLRKGIASLLPRECGQVRRKQTRRAILRFLSLTLAHPLKPCHDSCCKAGNLKEKLVSFGIISTFAIIKRWPNDSTLLSDVFF